MVGTDRARSSAHATASVVRLAGLLLSLAFSTAHAQSERRTLEHQSVAREYILANAAAARAAPAPVILVLHGRRGVDEPNRSSVQLDALAARERFVAVYPAGIGGVWNWPTRVSTAELPLSKANGVEADDVGFFVRLMDRLISERIADPTRIYVSGASMGGFMTFGLMCRLSTRIAAAAAMIAAMSDRQVAACEPRRAVPVAMLVGTRDEIVPYAGRRSEGFRLLSAQDTLMFWSEVHGCAGLEGTKISNDKPPGGIATVRIEGTGCRIGGGLRLYRVDGGGHTLPSKRAQSEAELQRFGPRSTEFETSEEVWAFLKRFRL